MSFSVASLGEGGPPRVTLSRGDTRRKFFCGQIYKKIVDRRDRIGKKGVGSPLFSEKIGVTPSVADPGDTHPSDANGATGLFRTFLTP